MKPFFSPKGLTETNTWASIICLEPCSVLSCFSFNSCLPHWALCLWAANLSLHPCLNYGFIIHIWLCHFFALNAFCMFPLPSVYNKKKKSSGDIQGNGSRSRKKWPNTGLFRRCNQQELGSNWMKGDDVKDQASEEGTRTSHIEKSSLTPVIFFSHFPLPSLKIYKVQRNSFRFIFLHHKEVRDDKT